LAPVWPQGWAGVIVFQPSFVPQIQFMRPPPRRNWLKTIIHFVFGLVVGAVVGVFVWMRLHKRGSTEPLSLENDWMLIGGCALVFGLLAVVFTERFWGED
jgi:polyferredoxin